MTDGTTWLAEPQSIAFGGYYVVLARGLAPDELVGRLVESVNGWSCKAVAVGDRTGDGLLEFMDDTYGGCCVEIGLRLGRAGDWTYAVAYGGWQGEFGSLTPSRETARTSASCSSRRRTASRSRRSSSTRTTAAS